MVRSWVGDQLVGEIHTEEEEEIFWYEYSYDSERDPFPAGVWVGGSAMPPPTGLPRPTTARELAGGLFGSNTIEVRCADE